MIKTEAKPAIAAVNDLFATSPNGLREMLEGEMADAFAAESARPLGSATAPVTIRAP